MTLPANLDQLTADELRELVRSQAEVITRNDRELNWRQVKIDKLTHEVAYYKRHYLSEGHPVSLADSAQQSHWRIAPAPLAARDCLNQKST